MRRWLPLVIAALGCTALIVVFKLGFGKDPHEVPFMLKGQSAPAFNVRSLATGERVTLEQRKGRPLVINFWASWCGPCKMEHPVLEWGFRNFSSQVEFMGVIFDDTEENARKALLAQGGSSLPQYLDPNSTMAVDYGTSGVPETYFIDSSGVIRDKFVGPIDPDSLRQHIEALQKPLAAAEATK